jgi:hypothetical protein
MQNTKKVIKFVVTNEREKCDHGLVSTRTILLGEGGPFTQSKSIISKPTSASEAAL